MPTAVSVGLLTDIFELPFMQFFQQSIATRYHCSFRVCSNKKEFKVVLKLFFYVCLLGDLLFYLLYYGVYGIFFAHCLFKDNFA